jgi:ATP-binding protein involved in chromosome partitioning
LKLQLRGPEREIPFVRPDSKTRVFAIASGKGGVGKSSLTVNLAVAFAQKGLSVGIIDADIYGHSIPRILGLSAEQTQIDPDLRIPPSAHGVKALSVLGMKGGDTYRPVALRGPMLGKMLEQFLADFYWGDLDILLLDLPPGTGDIAISTAQLLPNAELIVVTTPQIAAAEVSERAGRIAHQLKQHIIGVIENMSDTSCLKCGEPIAIFGTGGGAETAKHLSSLVGADVALIGQIPFAPALREGGDIGQPIVISDPTCPASEAFAAIVEKITLRPKSLVGVRLSVS